MKQEGSDTDPPVVLTDVPVVLTDVSGLGNETAQVKTTNNRGNETS